VLQDRLIALANGPETAEGHIDRAAATEAMWRLNPAIADFERMGIALRPYVERICEPNYTSQTLTTDQHGFRHLWKESRAIGYDEFVGTPGPKGIICGASQALGYGLANAHTLQANLTFLETSGAEWFSLAAPISNILQRRLLFELFAPPETKYCIVVSGTVNVLLSLLTTHDRAPYPPLHIVSYEWQKDDVALQGGQGIDKAFAETLVWMKHNITMFAAKCLMLGDCRLPFIQPPVLPWSGKKVTNEEVENRHFFRIRYPEYAALIEAPENVPRWIAYLEGIAEAVREEGRTYLEMLEEIDPDSDDTLFCDLLHPNETGAKLMATCISDWADGIR